VICARFLLIPDAGGLSIPTFRVHLGRLVDLQRATDKRLPMLVVATTSVDRVRAWTTLVEQVSYGRGWPPLLVTVTTWAAIGQDTQSSVWSTTAHARMEESAAAAWLVVNGTLHGRTAPDSIDRRPPTIGIRVTASVVAGTPLKVPERAVLDLVGRHPFLPAAVLGDVLGRDARWVARRRKALVDRGLLRRVTHEELHRSGLARGDLLELTSAGLRTQAAHLGLSLAGAVSGHGVANGGPDSPIGTRRTLLAHLDHTVGADAVFGVLARAARAQPGGALVEWRNAAACAHGRMRPDGYGVIHVGRHQYGFFLEFDRGTVRPAPLRAKFAAYNRYLSSDRASREFDSAPSVLVVTVGPGAEDRRRRAAWRPHLPQRHSRWDRLVVHHHYTVFAPRPAAGRTIRGTSDDRCGAPPRAPRADASQPSAG
jgi:Replication-relaxation